MPPKAEENGARAQEREANCSLQRKLRKRARMLIVAGGHTVPSTKHGKLDFHYSEKNEPFGNSYCNFDFLIITKNLGGLAAMLTVQSAAQGHLRAFH